MRGITPVLTALLLLGPLLLGWASPVEAAPEGKVAVVDVLDLLDHHPDTVKLRQKLKADEAAALTYLKESQQRLEKLREEILALSDGPERRRKQARFDKQRWNSKYDFEQMGRESQWAYVKELERIYAGVVAVIRNYARKNGISVVMQMTDDELSAADQNDYVMKIALRTVVYFEPSIDITEQVRALFPRPVSPPPAPAAAGARQPK